jgi:hypothetical protein
MLGETFGLRAGLTMPLFETDVRFLLLRVLGSFRLPNPVEGELSDGVFLDVEIGVAEPDGVLNGPSLGVFLAGWVGVPLSIRGDSAS